MAVRLVTLSLSKGRLVALVAIVALAGASAEGPEARAHWPVATANAKAQDLIDRGVAMLYAFDMGEARVAFETAAREDDALALPYAGAALADTLDINFPSTPDGERRGAAAVAKAQERVAHASAGERALVNALERRFAGGDRDREFHGFAQTLDAYVRGHRDDANLLTVAAYADYLAADAFVDANGEPNAQARTILDDLSRALVLDPDNLGAHHLRIHVLENASRAHEAIPDAQALDAFVYPPGESHLPHMAGHVWDRVGDYDKLIASAQRALANDRAWFALGDGPGQQYMRRYHDHDVDFLLYGLTTVGRDDEARAAVRDEDAEMRARLAIRLHDGVSAHAAAASGGAFLRALAAAREGDASAARAAASQLRGDDALAQRAIVDGILARAAGATNAALVAYGPAYERVKSSFPGDPKDFWIAPLGEGYGAALLEARQFARAEAVFTAELRRFPGDPRLEWGLAEAQKAQGHDDAAARAAYRTHWKGNRELTLRDLG